MDNDIRTMATAIFNHLNRYLNYINYKSEYDVLDGDIVEDFFKDARPSRFKPNHTERLDKELETIAIDVLDDELSDSPSNYDTILLDILSDDEKDHDGRQLDHKNSTSNISRINTDESELISDTSESEPDEVSGNDDELISNLSSDREVELEENTIDNSADSNFVNYTYWSVETGENVSTTSRPVYFSIKNSKVSLLQEAEAFVAEAFWGSDQNLFKTTPRHLLLQVTQIANRAFFDPDYRKYLQLTYV